MNDTFLNTAFSTEEQFKILSTKVSADEELEYTNPGKDTTDKVFLLSINEVMNNKYFNNDESRKCVATAYAKAETYVYVGRDDVTCYWWLRSPGGYQNCAAHVDDYGEVDHAVASANDFGVRPALWINLYSKLFKSGIFHSAAGENLDNV